MEKLSLFKTEILVSAVLLSTSLLAVEVTNTIELSIPASGDLIMIQNLAGDVQVRQSQDDQVHITGTVTAKADNEKDANALLEEIKFLNENKSDNKLISVTYPVDDYRGFIYNRSNKNQKGFFNGMFNTSSNYMGERVQIASKKRGAFGKWANVYTDLIIELPVEQKSKVRQVAGAINGAKLNNDLSLDTGSGSVRLIDSQGLIHADTGSGKITIENFSGNIDADTGSGGITINKVIGRVKADTGSGGIEVNDYLGGDLLDLDTGSGGIRVNGDLGNVEKLKIDTGSGSVKIKTSTVPSLDLDIETGSGSIKVDLPDTDVIKDKRGDYRAKVAGGRGKAHIDTGSGSVRFEMDDSYKPAKDTTDKQTSNKNIHDNTDEGSDNPELAERIRKALNKDKNIRKANLTINARGDRAIISGEMDNLFDIAKTVKIANGVDGVKSVSIDLESNDD